MTDLSEILILFGLFYQVGMLACWLMLKAVTVGGSTPIRPPIEAGDAS